VRLESDQGSRRDLTLTVCQTVGRPIWPQPIGYVVWLAELDLNWKLPFSKRLALTVAPAMAPKE